MPLEIERKFLVTSQMGPEIPSLTFLQAYDLGGTIRVRLTPASDLAELTLKKGEGLVRQEWNSPIKKYEVGEKLYEFLPFKIVKDRYYIDRWEIDIYHEPFKPLQVAEIELTSEDEPLPEVPEEITILKEVTGESFWSNHSLALLINSDKVIQKLIDDKYVSLI